MRSPQTRGCGIWAESWWRISLTRWRSELHSLRDFGSPSVKLLYAPAWAKTPPSATTSTRSCCYVTLFGRGAKMTRVATHVFCGRCVLYERPWINLLVVMKYCAHANARTLKRMPHLAWDRVRLDDVTRAVFSFRTCKYTCLIWLCCSSTVQSVSTSDLIQILRSVPSFGA